MGQSKILLSSRRAACQATQHPFGVMWGCMIRGPDLVVSGREGLGDVQRMGVSKASYELKIDEYNLKKEV